uniref:BLM10_mid domain-containing protein n=1 Tax=Mesocestoides corti TaxID=53468 RepID=A0A5K3FQH4_MESCO
MKILCNYEESSVEEKRFLIVNCDNVFQDHDNPDWMLSVLDVLASLLEGIDRVTTNSRHKLPDVPLGSSKGRTPWTFTPHNAQYVAYLMSRLLGSKAVDVRSRNLIHKVILRVFKAANGSQVKAALLRFSKSFAKFLTPAEVKDLILPLLSLCLNSRNVEAQVGLQTRVICLGDRHTLKKAEHKTRVTMLLK